MEIQRHQIVHLATIEEANFQQAMEDFYDKFPNHALVKANKGNLLPCPFCHGRFLTLEPGSHSCFANGR